MTPNEITTLIASNFDRELDVPFKLQLMDRVKYWRSRMIANALQKEPGQRKFFRQTLYMKMKQTNSVPCAELISCPVAITEKEVPTMIRVGTTLFDYVGGPDGYSPFQETAPGTGLYLKEGKFAAQFPLYEYSNHYIITPKADQPLIRVDGIFDDPMKVMEFSCSQNGIPCDTWNTEFPISGDILQLVVQSILQIDYNRPEQRPSEGTS